MKKFLNFGIQDEYPQYIKQKLHIANVLWVLLFFLAGGYSLIIYKRIPDLYFVPVIGTVCMFAALFLHLLQFHRLYRLILTAGPTFSIYAYHVGAVAEGNPALPSSIALLLAFSVFPFILFDVREKLSLLTSVLIGYAALISFRWTNSWVEIPGVDEVAIRAGYYQEFSITASFLILCLAVYSLTNVASKAQLKQEKLLQEGEQKNLELLQKGAELQDHLRKLEVSQQEEQQRNWASQGFTQFASILRRNEDLKQLSDELLKELTKYLSANQGALYVVEGEKEELRLELKACYAYSRKKYIEKSILPGEGLVGQSYLEQDTIYISDVPKGYTHITSGLGDATPANILIVPLIANDKVEGVLEFASFATFPAHVTAFVEKLGIDIAATLSISRINSLTRRLLEESREQTEQMRSQEEEMRQNMEELAATQEEMQRKEQEYLRRIQELEQKVAVLETTTLASV